MSEADSADFIAVIGLACRFAQAADPATFWDRLRDGTESITELSEEEMAALPAELRDHPGHVNRSARLGELDLFDAELFGLSGREAAAMDPQQRFFLEVGWEALERAGYHGDGRGPAVGVFAGASSSGYVDSLLADETLRQSLGALQISLGNDKDHIATRLSYFLNLRGPGVSIQTGCSTSLVAVHIACQNLLNMECDIALAGGSSIRYPNHHGYIYEEGGVLSPDGRCRAFDARSRGTAQGNGVGLVVLKRLDEAVGDGDYIHAVIRGSAINNDGAAKVGYTAPSVEGQRRVIEEAIALAGVEPSEISYIEAHGTGTTLGDPIEMEALHQAFGTNGRPKGDAGCALGSVKTNIGHCDAASGVAGLIKTILCLEHATLVPSLHFETPNPQIDFDAGPFYVNTQTRSWEHDRRYAGVSSFGIGGTNAHVVLSDGPQRGPSDPSRGPCLATFSARTPAALQDLKKRLRDHLADNPEINLADWAFTLGVGRRALPHRDAVVFRDREGLLSALETEEKGAAKESDSSERLKGRPRVIFVFPGQGIDAAELGWKLRETEPAWREAAERCFEILRPLGVDLHALLEQDDATIERELRRPSLQQPALFTAEYALARLWMSWGVEPTAMLGHSLGEIVAATLAGVLRLEDALRLVALRGRLTEQLPEGAMLAVPMTEEEVRPSLRGGVSLAAANAPGLMVVSGPVDEIEALEKEWAACAPIRLPTRRAFHSSMVEPMLAAITQMAADFEMSPPQIPYFSGVTGTWMSDEDAADPAYWARHLRQPVRFADALAELTSDHLGSDPGHFFLEVGPGEVLSRLIRREVDGAAAAASLAVTPGDDPQDALLAAVGKLWRSGGAVDWHAFYSEEKRHRLPLPTYPFQRRSFWFDSGDGSPKSTAHAVDPLTSKNPPERWFYLPAWKQAPRIDKKKDEKNSEEAAWLLLAPAEDALGDALEHALGQGAHGAKRKVHRAPTEADLGRELFAKLADEGMVPDRILYVASASATDTSAVEDFDRLILLAQALGDLSGASPVRLSVVTRTAELLLGEPSFAPAQASLLGLAQVLPKEFSQVSCHAVDVELAADAPSGEVERLAEAILREASRGDGDEVVALRRGRRWLPTIEPLDLSDAAPSSPYREDGVYLVTQGLQEIGLALAERLSRRGARVILVDRSFFPSPAEWDDWLAAEGEDEMLSRKILRLRSFGEEACERIRIYSGDIGDRERLERIREEAEREHGPICGVFHLGEATPPSGLIAGKSARTSSAAVSARIREVRWLAEVFPRDLDFLAIFSWNAAESGGLGQVDQAATCGVLERFAQHLREDGRRALTIAWGTRKWQDKQDDATPMGSVLERQLELKREGFGMTQEECLEALEQALALSVARAIVSTRDFEALMEQQSQFTADFFQQQIAADGESAGPAAPFGRRSAGERPDLDVPYAPPRNDVEKLLAEEWKRFFDLSEIGIHDSFFELGGHSLLAVQILKQINETFATELGLSEFFDGPTIAGIAQQISGGATAEEDPDLDELLREIENLSEDELEAALAAQGEVPE